jgi:hypothetical protein
MDLFNSALVPFTLMVSFSSATIVTVFKSRLRISRRRRGNKSVNSTITAAAPNSSISARDVKFAITSLTLNVVFLTLSLPQLLWRVFKSGGDPDLNHMLFYIFNLFSFVPYESDFILELISNSIFREEFFKLFNLEKIRTTRQTKTLTLSSTKKS